MADYVSIANLAASKLGEDDQLRSPDDDTHLGRSVKAVYDMVRRAAIRGYTWNFASRRAELPAEDLPSIPYPWQSSFPLPADSVRLVKVLNRASRSDYQVEGRSILTNGLGPLYIRYLIDVPEPALWDDLFVEAFASRLAFQIADRITGDRGRKADAWSDYKNALSEAKKVDALENPQVEQEPSGWELARTSGGDGRPFGYRVDAAGVWRDPVI
ncbi:hypothetical protein BH09PSE4_BH09PSE4_19270 [soil metagenome]